MIDDPLGWIVAVAVGLASLVAVVLLVMFLGVYTIRYRWEGSGAGRAIVAAGSGVLLQGIGDLTRFAGWPQTADVLTSLGSLWLATVLVWGTALVIRGGAPVRGGSVLEPPRPSDWRRP